MSIQTELETGLLALMRAVAGLASVKTFEADIRDCLFTGEKLTQGFRTGELPALNLSATLDPTQTSPFTASEVLHEIPVSIVVITKDLNRKAAWDAAKALQESVEGALNGLRKSGNGLDAVNTLLFGQISSSALTVKEEQYWCAVGTTAAKITKITALP